MNSEVLYQAAKEASEHSYSPYSRFRVGAALLCEDGTIIKGANIENRSYGGTICAERNAFTAALSAGHNSFKEIAVFCADAEYPVPPCGICRQFMSEFVDTSFPVHYSGGDGNFIQKSMAELFPEDSLHELKNR
ncbi:MAG: cytidine deaminase [Spirochaetia bacterium]|nr:cytidine deaminase [Spirochaetales bacterium]MCF7944594.1 cytidine deaminase [Spirochaetia bacterium]